MAKTASGLIEYVKTKIGVPYVYGMKMQVMTRAMYDSLKRQYGSMVWDSDVQKVGKVCCDCSGLISAYTGVIQGSSQMKATATKSQPISTIKEAPPGALVWQQGHVGVYIGMENGVPMYIAEDGSAYGCRKNQIDKAKFTHWILSNYIDYSLPEPTPEPKEEYKVEKVTILINGKTKTIDAINKDGYNYVKLRGLESPHIIIGYDDKNKMPIVDTK